MLNKKQVVVIGAVVILMAGLLSLDIKGLVKPEEKAGNSNAQTAAAPAVTLESVSLSARQELNANLANQVAELEKSLKNASGAEKLALQKKLAQSWDDVNKTAPAGFYYELIASEENNYQNWLKAGDRFTEAYQNTQDTLIQPALVQKAMSAYQNALKLDEKSLDAKTGLGVAIVNGSNPMEGIQLLLAVVKEDPNNLKANLNLGLFSMKSGQFDKAVSRFKTVIAQKPEPEAWFYLAYSYENIGMKEEAAMAYLKCKELAADPSLGQFIDRKIKELRQ